MNVHVKTVLAKYVRVRGILALLALTGLVALYFTLFLDLHLRMAFERIGTILNGAEVNIAEVNTSFVKGSLELKGVQLAHHLNPMKNLLEVDRVRFLIDFTPLFRKKLIIRHLSINGLHHGTARRTSGEVDMDTLQKNLPTSFIDRVATGLYSGIRSELSDNPLRYLGQLSTGLNLKSKLDTVRKSYASERAIVDGKNRLNLLAEEWDKMIWQFPTKEALATAHKKIEAAYLNRTSRPQEALKEAEAVRSELHEHAQNSAAKLNRVNHQVVALQGQMQGMEKLVQEDVNAARKALGLPRTDFDDLSPQIFGPRLLGYLERLSYWVDLGRRRMPKGTANGPVLWVLQPRSVGTSVHFGKLAGNPTFLIKEVEIQSDISNDPTHGKVNGRITGITSDPAIYGHPLVGEVDIDFPNMDVRGIRATISIDHTGDKFVEDFSLKIDAMPLDNWTLTNTGDLMLRFRKATVGGTFSASFREEELKAQWSASAKDVDFQLSSLYKQAEEVVRTIITPIYSFEVSGAVEGPFDKLRFNTTSLLGRRLAEGLKREYRHQFAAIDDNLMRIILDQIEPKRMDFNYRFGEVQQKFISPMEERVKRIQDLYRLADQTVSRLAGQKKRGVTRNITSSSK